MKLFRSIATVGGMTMISRVLGFVRDILIAAVLGTGWVADAFFVAFRFPNLFRRLFAEGAFNAAFVPLFAKRLEGEGPEPARTFAQEALAGLLTVVLALTAVAEITMPWLMYVIAPGFSESGEKFDLAVLLTRIAFPYLLCMSVIALLSGILNAMGKFAVAAAAPIMLNIVLISVMVGVSFAGYGNTPEAGVALSWGVAVAGFVQLAALVWAVRKESMGLALRRPRLTPGVRRLVRLGIPGVIGGGITQINILVGTIIASLQASAVSWLYYADRIYQLPLGIVGVAIGVVLLPDISRKLRAGENEAALSSMNRSLEFSLLITLPAAVALAVVPEPIIRVLFERGAFTAADTPATAWALAAFAAGLPAFVLIKVFSPGFFAREDTKTPMYYAAASIAVNITGSLCLFYFIGHVGIAVATSLAGWVNTLLLMRGLASRSHFAADDEFRRRFPRLCLSSLLMGAGLWAVARLLESWFDPASGLAIQIAGLSILVGSGLAVYGLLVQVTGAADLRMLARGLRRR